MNVKTADMLRLSYTSLNQIHNGHEWVNKTLGIHVPDYPFLSEGREAHKIIQSHVSGKKQDDRLAHIEEIFPVVEEKDFDERCKFSFNVTPDYEIFGYIDGLDPENKRFLEIKTGTPWSMSKFKESMQRKIYSLALLDFKEAYLITGSHDLEKWKFEPPKIYSMEITKKDRDDAHAWIADGIAKLEAGDFRGGLDEHGKCMGCFYNMPRYSHLATCHFK